MAQMQDYNINEARKQKLRYLEDHWIIHSIRIPFEILCGTIWIILCYSAVHTCLFYYRILKHGYKDKGEYMGYRDLFTKAKE